MFTRELRRESVPRSVELAYVREKKRIEYEAAEPYLRPVAGPESEAQLRRRVREALAELPIEERLALKRRKRRAYETLVLEHRETRDS